MINASTLQVSNIDLILEKQQMQPNKHFETIITNTNMLKKYMYDMHNSVMLQLIH